MRFLVSRESGLAPRRGSRPLRLKRRRARAGGHLRMEKAGTGQVWRDSGGASFVLLPWDDTLCAKFMAWGTNRRFSCWMDYRELISALHGLHLYPHRPQQATNMNSTPSLQAITCVSHPPRSLVFQTKPLMTACPCAPCARAHTGEAACRAFQQSGTQRSDADLPVHIARHALLACAPIVARQTQDPLRRRDVAGQRHPDSDSTRRGDPAPARDGPNGCVGRRALVPCTLHPPLVPPLLSLLALRGRGGVVVGKTDGCLG